MTIHKSIEPRAGGMARRQFIAAALACVASAKSLAALPLTQPSALKNERWLSALGDGRPSFLVGGLSNGRNPSLLSSNFRGHGLSVNPVNSEQALMFARSPGVEAVRLNLAEGVIDGHFTCAPNRHLFGHGCFNADGTLLFTTETNTKTHEGLIVVRDSQSLKVLDEFTSGGIGPHEIRLMPDGKRLVVANGGLLTKPESGKTVFNLDAMDSSLVYLNVANGDILDQQRVSEPKASIRHLDVSSDGVVALAMQLQREATGHNRLVPLTGVHRAGTAIELLAAPETVMAGLNDYVGSVAINSDTRIAGFTSPRGNLALFWHIDSGQLVGHHSLRDVCGLAVSADRQYFILTSSIGQVRLLDANTLREDRTQRVVSADLQWDNHLAVSSW